MINGISSLITSSQLANIVQNTTQSVAVETTLKSIDPGLTLLTNDEYTEVVDEVGYYYTAYAKALNSYGNTEQNYLNAVEITKYYQTRYNSGKIEFKDYLEAIHKQNSLQDELIQQKYQIIKYENYVYKAMAGKY